MKDGRVAMGGCLRCEYHPPDGDTLHDDEVQQTVGGAAPQRDELREGDCVRESRFGLAHQRKNRLLEGVDDRAQDVEEVVSERRGRLVDDAPAGGEHVDPGQIHGGLKIWKNLIRWLVGQTRAMYIFEQNHLNSGGQMLKQTNNQPCIVLGNMW